MLKSFAKMTFLYVSAIGVSFLSSYLFRYLFRDGTLMQSMFVAIVLVPVLFGYSAGKFFGYSRRTTLIVAGTVPLIPQAMYYIQTDGNFWGHFVVPAVILWVLFSSLGWTIHERLGIKHA